MPTEMEVLEHKLPVLTNVDKIKNVRKMDVVPERHEIGFETSMSYRNGFPYPVVMIMRNGIAIKIPASSSNWHGGVGFSVHIRYRFPRHVNIDAHRLLDEIGDSPLPELKALREAVSDARANVIAGSHECTLVYTVTKSEFERAGFSMHLQELDISLAKANEDVLTVHPDSDTGRQLKNIAESETSGFIFNIRINDPRKMFGERFINIAGHVYRVKSIVDRTKPEGVYVRTPASDDPSITEERVIGFDKADVELMLFRTAHDAKELGNIADRKKMELDELALELKKQAMKREAEHKEFLSSLEYKLLEFKSDKNEREAQLAEQLHKLKEDNIRLEQEAREREHKAANEKAEREKRSAEEKEKYEQRSARRKDWSEFVKWLPTVVVAVGILIAKYNESKEKKEK